MTSNVMNPRRASTSGAGIALALVALSALEENQHIEVLAVNATLLPDGAIFMSTADLPPVFGPLLKLV
jgi:hypothetical protein